MAPMTGSKWEKTTPYRPVHNIISSDFPRYNPQPWKCMEGNARIEWLLSYEYQRMWLEERKLWNKKMYPENVNLNVDIVKRYVMNFKNTHTPPKPEKKKPFKIKKFENVESRTKNTRATNDRATAVLRERHKDQPQASKEG